ncbi:DDE-type integrase/transposase/recombinase, partial [Porphyromonas levii]
TDLVKECIEQYGCPEIINSDQGVQYTSKKWVELLEEKGIRISRAC